MSRQIAGLKILFGKEYHKWAWTSEQLSYTTPVYIAEKIAELTRRIYGSDVIQQDQVTIDTSNQKSCITVWDMFAGLGVDSVSLARLGFKIYGTELSDEIFELLQKNINSFGLKENIIPFNADCLEKLKNIKNDLEVDIVYFDPPWGESFTSNKIFSFRDIKLSNGIYVIDLLREIYTNCTRHIVIKSPLKCNTFEELDFLNIYRIFVFRKHHLKFIFCR